MGWCMGEHHSGLSFQILFQQLGQPVSSTESEKLSILHQQLLLMPILMTTPFKKNSYQYRPKIKKNTVFPPTFKVSVAKYLYLFDFLANMRDIIDFKFISI